MSQNGARPVGGGTPPDRPAVGIERLQQRSVDATASNFPQAALRLRRQRQVELICRTPRLVFELLDEIGRHHGLGEDIDRRLDRYSGLDRNILVAVGGDRFPSSPVRAIGGGR